MMDGGADCCTLARSRGPSVPTRSTNSCCGQPDLRTWLPETHLALYVSDVVDALDLSATLRVYAAADPRDGVPYHPAMMVTRIARAAHEWLDARAYVADGSPREMAPPPAPMPGYAMTVA